MSSTVVRKFQINQASLYKEDAGEERLEAWIGDARIWASKRVLKQVQGIRLQQPSFASQLANNDEFYIIYI